MTVAFAELVSRMGIECAYTDGTGERRHASDEAVMKALRAMGCEINNPAHAGTELERLRDADSTKMLDPVCVFWIGRGNGVRVRREALRASRLECSIRCENGETVEWATSVDDLGCRDHPFATLDVPPEIQAGIHLLEVVCGPVHEKATLIIAEPECFQSPVQGTAIGIFIPMHALRSGHNLGVGTLGDLARLCRWASTHGVRHVGTLPLLSNYLDEPFDPSPYAPISRSIFGEHFLDFERLVSNEEFSTFRALMQNDEFERDVAGAKAGRMVDYRAVWAVARRCLEALRDDAERSERLRADIGALMEDDALLAEYARFRGKTDGAERRLFECAQWLLSKQIDAAGESPGTGLYLDLPIGSHGAGFDVHRDPGLYAEGFSLGAPPDALFPGGQSWGFPPRLPRASRARGHREFIEAVARHMRVASALRIDHAIGLHRCFWVPNGADATDGVYVREPAEEYYAILSVLSRRHECVVIGENLGTVPPELNESLASHRVMGMRIAQFDLGKGADPIPHVGEGNLAALNTHDTPTFAAHWRGLDIGRRVSLGLTKPGDAQAEQVSRREACARVTRSLCERGLLDRTPGSPEDVFRAIVTLLGEQHPEAMVINLEDIWGEADPQNVPGIVNGYPNWRRRAELSLEEIMADPRVETFLGSLCQSTA